MNMIIFLKDFEKILSSNKITYDQMQKFKHLISLLELPFKDYNIEKEIILKVIDPENPINISEDTLPNVKKEINSSNNNIQSKISNANEINNISTNSKHQTYKHNDNNEMDDDQNQIEENVNKPRRHKISKISVSQRQKERSESMPDALSKKRKFKTEDDEEYNQDSTPPKSPQLNIRKSERRLPITHSTSNQSSTNHHTNIIRSDQSLTLADIDNINQTNIEKFAKYVNDQCLDIHCIQEVPLYKLAIKYDQFIKLKDMTIEKKSKTLQITDKKCNVAFNRANSIEKIDIETQKCNQQIKSVYSKLFKQLDYKNQEVKNIHSLEESKQTTSPNYNSNHQFKDDIEKMESMYNNNYDQMNTSNINSELIKPNNFTRPNNNNIVYKKFQKKDNIISAFDDNEEKIHQQSTRSKQINCNETKDENEIKEFWHPNTKVDRLNNKLNDEQEKQHKQMDIEDIKKSILYAKNLNRQQTIKHLIRYNHHLGKNCKYYFQYPKSDKNIVLLIKEQSKDLVLQNNDMVEIQKKWFDLYSKHSDATENQKVELKILIDDIDKAHSINI